MPRPALSRLHRLAGALRLLSELPPDAREGLRALGHLVGAEHVAARRAPAIDPTAIVSPLASLRFVERVEIGPRATINPYACVWGGWSTARVSIGAGAMIGTGCALVAGNHVIDVPGPIRDLGFEEADVEVGEGAMVAANAVVIGCRVGREAVVGANAVVTSDVPDHAIAVGVPARIIGHRPAA